MAAGGRCPSFRWGDSTSKTTYGHTFERHGAGVKNPRTLVGRAGGTRDMQGQWLDDGKAAQWLAEQRPGLAGPITVPLPEGMGQVVYPGGGTGSASRAVLVPNDGGGYTSAYPVE